MKAPTGCLWCGRRSDATVGVAWETRSWVMPTGTPVDTSMATAMVATSRGGAECARLPPRGEAWRRGARSLAPLALGRAMLPRGAPGAARWQRHRKRVAGAAPRLRQPGSANAACRFARKQLAHGVRGFAGQHDLFWPIENRKSRAVHVFTRYRYIYRQKYTNT